MGTAALLEKRGTKYFKIGLDSNDNSIKQKLRIMRGFRKIGLNYYYLPFTEAAIDFLIDNDFEFNGAFIQMREAEYAEQNPIKKIPKYKKLELKPYKYQFEGVNFIETHNGRAIIADVMGLGKTIQALAWVQYRKDIKKVLITCPSSLKINWQEEFEKWVTRKMEIQILDGITPYEITGDVIIANYDILNNWVIDLKLTNFDLCIADELHYCKNDKSLRAKAFIEITKTIPYVVGLTGTPIENDPMEIFYLVNLVNKNIFPNYIKFIQRYCDAKQTDQNIRGGKFVEIDGKRVWQPKTRKVWRKGDFINQGELHRILKKHIMLRRTKEEVDLQLPPKMHSTIHVKIDNKREYQQAEEDFIKYIKQEFDSKIQKQLESELGDFMDKYNLDSIDFGKHVLDNKEIKKAKIEKLDAISRAPALAKIQALKLLAAEGKIQQVIDWIHDFMETDEKLIVFAINKIIVKKLMDAFPLAVKIDGSTTKAKRNEAVKRFQNDDKCRLFIGNMKAAGIGLTLTAASNVIIAQFPWNPGELEQAEDRAHRITQTKKVMIWKFVAKNTIEERIVDLLKRKQTEIDKIIDGKNTGEKQDLVKLLIESYK